MTKRFDGRIAAASATFIVTAVGVRVAFEALSLAPWTRALLAMLPVAAFAWFIWTELRAVRACDEFQQRVQLEALAVAYPVAIPAGVRRGAL